MTTFEQCNTDRSPEIEALRRLWREGVRSGESAPLDAEDIKHRGRKRLAALRVADG